MYWAEFGRKFVDNRGCVGSAHGGNARPDGEPGVESAIFGNFLGDSSR
jgi:hypothetical protein